MLLTSGEVYTNMRIAICDDKKKCRETIIEYVTPYINEENNIIYEEFESGESLLSSYNDADQTFDIIFLDIEMHGLNGVQIAEKIRELDKNAILIFVTNHINFVSDTFRVGAFQFLVKPIKEQDFKRALEQHKIGHHVYTIKYKENTFAFEVKNILYIEVYNRHLRLWANEGQYEFAGTLMAEEKKLSPYNFVNCHQSYLVNMNYIKRINPNSILLKNGTELPVSKSKRTHVKLNLIISYQGTVYEMLIDIANIFSATFTVIIILVFFQTFLVQFKSRKETTSVNLITAQR